MHPLPNGDYFGESADLRGLGINALNMLTCGPFSPFLFNNADISAVLFSSHKLALFW
jgi:hypothetical protein